MREIGHHLDAIEAGISGALEEYERSDTGAFFEPPKRHRKPGGPDERDHAGEHERPGERKLDDEMGWAEVAVVASGEIDLTEHPSGEIVFGEETDGLLAGLEQLDPHYLAAAIEIARVLANEFGDDWPGTANPGSP